MGRDFFVGGGNALHHIGETEKQVDFRGDTAKQRPLEFTGGKRFYFSTSWGSVENAERWSDGGFDPVFELLFGGRADGELVVGRRVGVQIDDGERIGGSRREELRRGERSVFPRFGGLGGLGGLGLAGWWFGWSRSGGF